MMIIDPYRFGGGGSCPSYTPGLYTAEEIDTLINDDGYIPVATAEEFDLNIEAGGSQTMGAGTCWEGSYTTGLDKKYIQVSSIDFTSYGNISGVGSIATRFDGGSYDGNELLLENCIINPIANAALFFTPASASAAMSIKNIRGDITINGIATSIAGIGAICTNVGVNMVVEDNDVTANITGDFKVGGLCGAVTGGICRNNIISGAVETYFNSIDTEKGGLICGEITSGTITGNVLKNVTLTSLNRQNGGIAASQTGGTIENNKIESTVDLSACVNGRIGGIVGLSTGGTVQNNLIECDISATNGGNSIGGVVGNATSTTILRNKVTGDVINSGAGALGAGGIVGLCNAGCDLDDNEMKGAVNGVAEVGGIIGRSTGTFTVDNSISTGAVTGTTFVGGSVGRVFEGSSTWTATYWDTTIGPATSPRGTGQTTSALQTPTTNSGIYSAWTIPPWAFGTTSEYPTLTTTP